MVFSNVNDGNGLLQECERITNLGAAGITGNAQLLKDFTSRINNALDRFHALAFMYDVNWNFDDTTNTDLPVATTSLANGTQDYAFDSSLLQVTQVFAKDSAGTWKELFLQDDKNTPNTYLTTTSGTPKYYELHGNSILLDPIPDYASSNGLKVTFKRNGPKFDSTDGAVAVGIPSLFHQYLCRYASYPYVMEKKLPYLGNLGVEIQRDELAIKEFISNRARPKRTRLKVGKQDNK